MEWICGAFSSSNTAAWVEAIGTVAAAGTAVLIYRKSRRDQRNDLAARRRVLHAVLGERVVAAANQSKEFVGRSRDRTILTDHKNWRLHFAALRLDGVERMVGLQSNLLQFGEDGDAAIAAFIEACLNYSETYTGWERYTTDSSLPQQDRDGTFLALLAVSNSIQRVAERADAALKAVKRFE